MLWQKKTRQKEEGLFTSDGVRIIRTGGERTKMAQRGRLITKIEDMEAG